MSDLPLPASRPYEPRGAARELFYCRDKIVGMDGPAGTGKSMAVLNKVYLCALKWPGSRHLITRKTRASLSQSVLVTFEDKVLPANSPVKSGAGREHRTSYRTSGGSEIVIGGLDNPDRIMSTEFDTVSIFEATETTEDDLDKLLTRLRNNVMPFQQVLMDFNPGPPGHWINAKANDGMIKRLRSRHEDNPLLWDAAAGAWTPFGVEYIATLDRLTGVRKKRLRFGEWAAAEGLVYEQFAEHVICTADNRPPHRLPSPAIRVCAGLDWGWSDALAVTVGAECHDGRLYIAEEMYEQRMPPDVLSVRLRELRDRWGIETFFCDPSRPELISLMRRYDIPCVPHKVRLIETGIALVETRLNAGYLKIYSACLNLCREAGEYEYEKTRDGRTKTVPKDVNNHAMDSLRYLVAGMDFNRALAFSPVATTEPSSTEPAPDTVARLGHDLAEMEAQQRRADEEAEARRLDELLNGDRGWSG